MTYLSLTNVLLRLSYNFLLGKSLNEVNIFLLGPKQRILFIPVKDHTGTKSQVEVVEASHTQALRVTYVLCSVGYLQIDTTYVLRDLQHVTVTARC